MNDDVTEEMLGSWTASLYKFHPSLGGVPKNGTTSQFVGPHKDLRVKLSANQPPTQPTAPETNDLRSLLTNIRDQAAANLPATQGLGRGTANRGRGSKRGRGSNSGRGSNGGRGNNQGGNRGGRGNDAKRNQIITSLVKLLS